MTNLFSRIHGRAASIAAAVLAIALACWHIIGQLQTMVVTRFDPQYLVYAIPLLPAILLLLAFLLPFKPRRGWLIALTALADVTYLGALLFTQQDQFAAFPSILITVLGIVLGANLILLIGAVLRKRTEPLAALAILGWMVYNIITQPAGMPLWATTSSALSMAAYAAMLLLHPVIERPTLGKTTK